MVRLLLPRLLQLNHRHAFFLFPAFFDAEGFDLGGAGFAHFVETQTVFLQVDEGQDLLFHFGELLAVKIAFEDAVLHALAEVQQFFRQPGALFGVDDVVGNEIKHKKDK